ncbi:hypothetical protein BDV95DRAFT_481506 [Massariosphaeria phaeospora]|uniref:F-box domain-containing protein n=1 Tax=Massariosphaeria phaeospora TaxID=100035 RepID=A0A7C8IH89_9PLEO|nr:hypothetical protein BDV95DRAFT_481506 [Massariosphaeria phaeospora]
MTQWRRPNKPSGFLALPAELRVRIYHLLLPYGQKIKFETVTSGRPGIRKPESSWFAHTVDGRDRVPLGPAECALFRVSKFVSDEARAVLYGENKFCFMVDSNQHIPLSLHSPLVFGPLGLGHRLGLLRNLRTIHLDVDTNDADVAWAVRRHRGRLDLFARILNEHAGDANQESLLTRLHVALHARPTSSETALIAETGQQRRTRHMFALESLAALRGIEEVHIEGVPPWFGECLERCMQGQGGDVLAVEWPDVWVKRKAHPNARPKKRLVTTRKCYQPIFNWKEFAERNGIAVPEDIDKYWAVTR